MDLIGNATWELYAQIIRDAHDTFSQEDLLWRRYNGGMNLHGEDRLEDYQNITLKALFQYNLFRVWAMDKITESGQTDEGNVVCYINLRYLQELGYVNSKGIFLYSQDRDRFEHRGIRYRSTGFTLAAQAKGENLFVQLNLQREDVPTGENQLP